MYIFNPQKRIVRNQIKVSVLVIFLADLDIFRSLVVDHYVGRSVVCKGFVSDLYKSSRLPTYLPL